MVTYHITQTDGDSKRRTNGNAITVDGKKPVLGNSIENDWIA